MIDTLRSDRPPRGEYEKGSWVNIVVCDKCRLHALYEDCHPAKPCPRCGEQLRICVGRWVRLSPKWKFWKNLGHWEKKAP
jgi:hypothetical protein